MTLIELPRRARETPAVGRTADALVRAYDPDGLNLIQNNRVIASQSVPFFHMHVVPHRKVGSGRGNGPPRNVATKGKTPTQPDRDIMVSLVQELEIARHVRRFLDSPENSTQKGSP